LRFAASWTAVLARRLADVPKRRSAGVRRIAHIDSTRHVRPHAVGGIPTGGRDKSSAAIRPLSRWSRWPVSDRAMWP
jgi:hypothetical protein